MTKKCFDQIAEGLREAVGGHWLETFREKFPDEFSKPEDAIARRAIEGNVAADRRQTVRPGRV